MSVTMRIAGRGGTSHACCAMNSFRQSFCTVPPISPARDAAHVGERDVEREQHDGRPVDGHRRRDLVERDVVEEDLHVAQRVDGDAAHADLAERARAVGVVAHEGGEIEGGREARLALREQVLEARVRLLRRAEAGEHAHRPEAAAVHRRLHAARERVLARQAEVAHVVERHVGRREHVGHVQVAPRGEARLARRHLRLGLRHGALAPRLYRLADGLEIPGGFAVLRVLLRTPARRGRARCWRDGPCTRCNANPIPVPDELDAVAAVPWLSSDVQSAQCRLGGGDSLGLVLAVHLDARPDEVGSRRG